VLGNAAQYFVDRHLAEGRGDKIAFREAASPNRTLSYAELADKSNRVADAYRAQGIVREDRAACILLDEIEYPIIFWGSLKCGVVPIALNTLLATDVYDVILRDSRASILFVSHALLDVVLSVAKPPSIPSPMKPSWKGQSQLTQSKQAQMNVRSGCILRAQQAARKACGMCMAH
jgi:acyl-CoA synthetase (AMP-forming)/AMP-acid ligase II